MDFLEEWSRRSLWNSVFAYVQSHFLTVTGAVNQSTAPSSPNLDRKANLQQQERKGSVGKGGGVVGNSDIRTMEGLRKAVNFNLVGPLFCDLVGIQLTGI